MRAAVVGVGALGARTARQTLSLGEVDRLLVADRDLDRAKAVARSLGSPAEAIAATDLDFRDVDVAVLAHPDAEGRAREALRAGCHVVVPSGLLRTAKALLALDAEARERGRVVVAGAGLSPGLSCLLALEAAGSFDWVASIDVSTVGAGGPACARERRSALASAGLRWDGAWHQERGGTGRRLAAFPDPVGAKDCFFAGTAEPLLLGAAFPGARVTATLAASAFARLTAALPPPPARKAADTALGAVRVELHGHGPGGAGVRVLGAIDRPALAGGAVAAMAAHWAVQGRFKQDGAAGLASLVVDPQEFLRELTVLGVRAAEFVGTS